jgi:acetoin utilization deacetylase AcuC-like enzyme
MKTIGIIRDKLYLQHENGGWHPESPSRLTAIGESLDDFAPADPLVSLPARDATHQELARIHTDEHIRLIEMSRERERTVFDPDTGAVSGSYAAAVRAAGGVIAAVDAVMSQEVDSAFAFVRPPGHHAEASHPMAAVQNMRCFHE